MREKLGWVIAVLGVCGLIFFSDRSHVHACSFAGHEMFEIDSSGDDVPPTKPTARVATVERARGSSVCGDGDSCDDIATVVIEVSASDDQTPAEELGYVFSLEGGRAPDGFRIPTEPLAVPPGGSFDFHWSEQSGDQALDVRVAVRAIDKAGNRSTESTVVRLSDGSECSVSSPRSTTLLVIAACVLAALFRSRRRVG